MSNNTRRELTDDDEVYLVLRYLVCIIYLPGVIFIAFNFLYYHFDDMTKDYSFAMMLFCFSSAMSLDILLFNVQSRLRLLIVYIYTAFISLVFFCLTIFMAFIGSFELSDYLMIILLSIMLPGFVLMSIQYFKKYKKVKKYRKKKQSRQMLN